MAERPVEHTLLATTDAEVWAQEFCRIFAGWTILSVDKARQDARPTSQQVVDEGTMVGWFANAIETGRNARPDTTEILMWCFQQNYSLDKSNASIHCAPVRFSPITFRLFETLMASWQEDEDFTVEMAEVRAHRGTYAEDQGR